MLLSPAKLNGKRGKMLMNPTAAFPLAQELRTGTGAKLADVFSFVSGLYFRGKVTYARQFGRTANGQPSAYVLTAGGGLCLLEERVNVARLDGWASVAIHEDNPHFTAPLLRTASGVLASHGDDARFVLLGSVATNKYVAPLLDVFGERLLFPTEFAGLGDMARGSRLLRAARDGRELAYSAVSSK
jgi:hypothetical protein